MNQGRFIPDVLSSFKSFTPWHRNALTIRLFYLVAVSPHTPVASPTRVTVIVLMIKETVTNLLLETLTDSFELYILLITSPLPLHLQLLLLLLLAHVDLLLLLLLCKGLKGYLWLCLSSCSPEQSIHT